LRLRCEFLTDFKEIENKFISEKYCKYKNSLLDETDIKKIKNFIKNVNKEIPKLGYKNLMTCYMIKCIITLLLKKTNNEFVKSIYEYLKKHYYLTEKQIVGVNKWIKNQKGIQKIRENSFIK